jgi:putative ATPase
MDLIFDEDALSHLVRISDGDARTALNSLETAASLITSMLKDPSIEKPINITLQDIEHAMERKALLYDKSGEEHYNLISALHKSLRGSDPDAAAYWLGRMLSAGEDPFFVARRMVRFASEDIGNADPHALGVALNAMEAFRFLGHPEGELALVQAAVYLATAPKSNSIYTAYGAVKAVIDEHGALPVPLHIRNAPTTLMRGIGYGKDYKYAHDYKDAYVPQDYLPEKLKGRRFYMPTERGYENRIRQLLEKWRELKRQKENTKKISK